MPKCCAPVLRTASYPRQFGEGEHGVLAGDIVPKTRTSFLKRSTKQVMPVVPWAARTSRVECERVERYRLTAPALSRYDVSRRSRNVFELCHIAHREEF